MAFRAAFYKGVRPGVPGIYNRGVRWWTRGPYSHCELVFSSGVSASASYMDGGVRFKWIEYDPAHWDFINLPEQLETKALAVFQKKQGDRYDLLGNVHFVISAVGDDDGKSFCSEILGEALGLLEPYRFSPNALSVILKSMFPQLQPA